MTFYAHTKNRDGATCSEEEWQPLCEHLNNVAAMAKSFALKKFESCAYLEGLLHDVGKYQKSFQERLRGSFVSVDHAVCGAREATELLSYRNENVRTAIAECITMCPENDRGKIIPLISVPDHKYRYILSYSIIGHHSGLPNKGLNGENADESALIPRLNKAGVERYDAYKEEIEISDDDVASAAKEIAEFFLQNGTNLYSDYEFLVRYLFSCLVDADFLDTERFVTGVEREKISADWEECGRRLDERLASFPADTPVNLARREIRDQAMKTVERDSRVYLLDMPTGSGKTLCSISLALERIRRTGKKRIIYVIPYTSIIEQTAATIERLFPNLTVLEHHSNFDFDDVQGVDGEISAGEKLKKATENWDAPLIVTTNVQFFESIYSNRSGKLRKMHNMGDSVLIFDEIHTMPLKYFIPCMVAIKELVENFESEAFFLTATMPDFSGLVKRYAGLDLDVLDLVPDKTLYMRFENVSYEYAGKVDVPSALDRSVSNLVVCNMKKTALEYYRRFDGENKYYLSTYMTPVHRSATIERIRKDLKAGKKPAVFSTSLIEAGVDLDFDCVWRELSGLDNILQTAGRCNREGRRDKSSSKVYIFESDADPVGEMNQKVGATVGCISNYGIDKISAPECIREYYDTVYGGKDNIVKEGKKYVSESLNVNFKDVAEDFVLIESVTEGVVVPDDKIRDLLVRLRSGETVSRRKLQRYTATVNGKELEYLKSSGAVKSYDGVNVLEEDVYYDVDTGIVVERDLDSVWIY